VAAIFKIKDFILLDINKKVMHRFILLLSCCAISSAYQSCQHKPDITTSHKVEELSVNLSIAYDFENPDDIFLLNQSLVEISGLAYDAVDEPSLIAVNDELGIYYRLSLSDGSIMAKHRFAAIGDYEAIEIRNDTIYIARSNGTIYQVDRRDGEAFKILKTDFHANNNIEGLTINAAGDQMIVACKDEASVSEVSYVKKGKALYAVDIHTGTIDPTPLAVIRDKDLKNIYVKSFPVDKKSHIKNMKVMDRVKKFAPSGLAVHPITKALYILSARNSSLIVLDQTYTLQNVILLDRNMHKQAEGICFAPNGDLYISNEGQNGRANIYMYRYEL